MKCGQCPKHHIMHFTYIPVHAGASHVITLRAAVGEHRSQCTCCCPATIEIALALAEPQTLRGCALVLGCLEGRPRRHALAVGSCHALMVLVLLLCCQLHAVLLRLLRCGHALLHLQDTGTNSNYPLWA